MSEDTAGRLAGQTVVVTGANRGIGRAMAQAFAAEGARLYLSDRDPAGLPALAKALGKQGAQVLHQALDVTDAAAVEQAMHTAAAEFGTLDVLVNCAGIFESRPLLTYPLADWQRILDINLTGTFLCTRAALQHMVPRRRGRVINLASVAGKMGGRNRAGYYASKHAVIGLTRCAAMEMAPYGITVNALCPGLIDTPMFDGLLAQTGELEGQRDPEAVRAELLKRVPLGRMIQPEEVAELAVFLASPQAATITGQAINVDGGMVMW